MEEESRARISSLDEMIRARKEFLEIAVKRKPMEFVLEKGDHQGETVRIETQQRTSSAVEYRGIVGNRVIAKMYANAPMAGFSQVTSSLVAKDYWRSGIATKIYSAIRDDLSHVKAKLEPQWGAMSSYAVRFWLDFAKDDPATHARLTKILEEMKDGGQLETDAEQVGEWDGEELETE